MPTLGDMTGKAALVTGAAAGLGRATALKLAQAGADIALVDINAEALDKVGEEVRALGRKALVQVVDLSKRDNCVNAVDDAVKAFGRLDALCNVAGYMLPAHTTEMSEGSYRLIMAVNLDAPFFLSQAAIPHLLEANGAIVNVTSCAAFAGQAYLAAYSASKAGLTHMTKSLAMEYIHQPIRINAVAPGGMMTNIASNFRPPEGADIALIKRYSGLRGLVEVDDVADMVAYLASPAGRGYHGSCVTIDKGITAG